MKVSAIDKNTQFKGVREDRKTVSQLKQNNNYSLTDPNQRRINKALENLAKQRGEENVKFLIDVAKNLKYQGHVPDSNIASKNEWSEKLKNATEESLSHSDPILKEKYQPEIDEVFSKKELTEDEKIINAYKKSILEKADKNEHTKTIEKNLNHFIVSSETPIEQKKYVMERLDYFMSPEYEINPQLKDKKTQVLYELTNDIAVNTRDKDIPNIKAINQKTHGMCGAISIARKLVAYEDKPNYVDAVLSELDSSDTVKVYDRHNLGSGKRVPVTKTPIDFEYAQEKGYRIIDASTLQWMHIAGKYGSQNKNLNDFSAFDKKNFDAYHDGFFMKSFGDEHAYYQALSKAKSDIGSVKSGEIIKDLKNIKKRQNHSKNVKELKMNNAEMRSNIEKIMPNASKENRKAVLSDIYKLQKATSSEIKTLPANLQKYAFIPNEEQSQKKKKIEQYFKEQQGEQNINKTELSNKSTLIIDILDDTNKLLGDLNTGHSKSSRVAQAKKMYKAEAAYRNTVVKGLKDTEICREAMIKNNIPDRETRIVNGLDQVIKKIEKNNDKKLLNHFAPLLGTTPDNKKEIVDGLTEIKGELETHLTKDLDDIYKSMGFGSKKDVLKEDIQATVDEINDGNKEELALIAKDLNVKPDKAVVMKKLAKMAKTLENNNDNKTYTEVLNDTGNKEQVGVLVGMFGAFTNAMKGDDPALKNMYLSNFKKANGMGRGTSPKELQNKLNEIGEKLKTISSDFADVESILEVPNEDGTPYFTIKPENLIIKKMENEGKLVPASTMRKMQDRFTKMDKVRSSDEFASRQGKISNKSLKELSNEEKQAVKQIEKKLNFMYSDVTRNLETQFREIREPLEELIRESGVQKGEYWVGADGNSGLFGSQQIKILEQLTDRPYYEETNITNATDVIKNTPHSGISSSSVFHYDHGGHAQYVADVVKDEKTGKDILFHDNTWGACEHENTWVDSEGKTRTDYSDRRGGELGYITNEDWRNGNYVDNLIYKKGHVSPKDIESKQYKKMHPGSNDEHDFTLMNDIIVSGKNDEYRNIAAGIKDTLFTSDDILVDNLEQFAKNMTKVEIQKAIFKSKSATEAYGKKYNAIIKRITPTTFNKGIRTEADYNNLSDKDPVKLAFEKAAVRDNFDDASMYKELAKAKSIKEVNTIKKKQRKAAEKDFKYSFYKDGANRDILSAAMINNPIELENTLVKPIKKYNIKADNKALAELLSNSVTLKENEEIQYNGSLKNSIEIITNRVGKQFDEIIPESENKEAAKKEFMENLNKFYEKNVYFNKEDLKADTPKTKAIRQWIDDKFEPETDDEFVNIYRSLQDMTSEEFNSLTKDIDDKYLGMKGASGYDILRKVLASNREADMNLRNVIYYEEFSHNADLSKTKPHFALSKLERNERGAIYIGERTFDDLYRTLSNDLSTLELPKMFAKHKEMAYRNNGVFPAYPELNPDLYTSNIDKQIDSTDNIMNKCLNAINTLNNFVYDIELANTLNEYVNSVPSDRKLTEKEDKTIKTMLNSFIEANQAEPTFASVVNAARQITSNENPETIEDYKMNLNFIIGSIKGVEKSTPVEQINNTKKQHIETVNKYINDIIAYNVPSRFRKTVKTDADKWASLTIAANKNNGLDKNKDVLNLQNKIMENASSDDKKAMLEDFIEMIDYVNEAKAVKSGATKDEKMLQLSELGKMSDKYVTNYIDPASRNGIKANLDTWFRKEIVGGNKKQVTPENINNAKKEFVANYKKHYIISYPQEALEDFLMLSAKDAKPSEAQKIYSQNIKNELEYAKTLEIQESLINAVSTGNAAHVKNEFDKFQIAFGNNAVNMNSDAAIDLMIRSLIIGDDVSVAKMFTEKLGLSKRAVEIEANVIKTLNPKGKVDSLVSTIKEADQFQAILNDECAKYIDAMNKDESSDEKINALISNISEAAKDFKNKDIVKKMTNSIKKANNEFKDQPNQIKAALMSQTIEQAAEQANTAFQTKVQEHQANINMAILLYNFIESIEFGEGDDGIELQKKAAKEQEDFIEYNNKELIQVSQQNPNVNINMGE